MTPTNCTFRYLDKSNIKCKNYNEVLSRVYRIIEKQIDDRNPYPLNSFELKNIFYYGFGNENIRAKSWKIFFNYTAKNKFKNEKYIRERRICYKEYLWKSLEQSDGGNDLLEDDVNRKILFPYYKNAFEPVQQCKFLDALTHKKITNRDIMKRILQTFKTTNSSIGYVQGMINILLPIYYVFSNSIDNEDIMYAEEDAYFCFFYLMTEIGDLFLQKMDYDKTFGIISKLNAVFEIVKKADLQLYEHLKKLHVIDSAFHFRWVYLLLTHEFPMSECIYLWDRLLSDCNRFEMVTYCSSVIILSMREKLMQSDYCECLEILQNHHNIDAQQIFVEADILRKKTYKKISQK